MPSRSRFLQVARGATYLAALAVLFTVRTPTLAPARITPGTAGQEAHRHSEASPDSGGRGVLIRILLGSVIVAGLLLDAGRSVAWR